MAATVTIVEAMQAGRKFRLVGRGAAEWWEVSPGGYLVTVGDNSTVRLTLDILGGIYEVEPEKEKEAPLTAKRLRKILEKVYNGADREQLIDKLRKELEL